jgi:hypothetical protein
MATAKKDNNRVPVLLGTSSVDGVTPIMVKVDASHVLSSNCDVGGSDLSPTDDAARDENRVPVLLGVSSADGITPVQIYVNANGEILLDC